MLRTTSAMRERPPSYKRKTVGSTSRTTYVAKMKAEVISKTSDTNSVSVLTGIKTLKRRIIGYAKSDKVNYTRDCRASQLLEYRDENRISRLSRHDAGGSARFGGDASLLRGEIRQCGKRHAQFRMGGGGRRGSSAPADRGAGGRQRARDRVHQRRHGIEQPGAEGGGGCQRRGAGAHRHSGDGAQSGAGYGQAARGRRLPGDDSGCARGRTGGPGRVARGDRCGDGRGERDVRQQ